MQPLFCLYSISNMKGVFDSLCKQTGRLFSAPFRLRLSLFFLFTPMYAGTRAHREATGWFLSFHPLSQSDMLGQQVFCCLTRCCPADPVPLPPTSWAAPIPGVWAAAIYLLVILSAWLPLLEWQHGTAADYLWGRRRMVLVLMMGLSQTSESFAWRPPTANF